MLCRAMAFPNACLLRHAERVLCYLVRTRDLGLRYETDQTDVRGASDSDWDVQRSTSGQTFMYNSAAISWGSKRQPSTALSSCEAEIMAASEGAKEAVYISTFLNELGMRDGCEGDEVYTVGKAPLLTGDGLAGQAALARAAGSDHRQ